MLIGKLRSPALSGQIELTYRCNLNCVHCYCKGLDAQEKELSSKEWKKIIKEIKARGCFCLVFSGGEPLLRRDFLDLYSFAKNNGFLTIIFTNGLLLKGAILKYLAKSPPYSVEITLNAVTAKTYESITRAEGSFPRIMENIVKIKENKIPLILKSNCLSENKNEIGRIKAYADKLLGRKKGSFHFKYDPVIYPGLNGNKEPLKSRLDFAQLVKLRGLDSDILRQFRKGICAPVPKLKRGKEFLYQCDSWRERFFIDPYGRLKFCNLTDKYSSDLKKTSFENGLKKFRLLLDEKFKTSSKCRPCRLRAICLRCPGRAYLETGDQEAAVPYYCALAKGLSRLIRGAKRDKADARLSSGGALV